MKVTFHILQIFVFIIMSGFTTELESSALVIKNDDTKTINIVSNLYFYGGEADSFGIKCGEEISRMWNDQNSEIRIKNTDYRVLFAITSNVITNDSSVKQLMALGKIENNFIRIETQAWMDIEEIAKFSKRSELLKESKIGYVLLGTNFGFFSTAGDLGESTTCAHEFGHGLGLTHPKNPLYGIKPGEKKFLTIWSGMPNIMVPRNTIVDPEYSINDKCELDPTKRIVTNSNISDLNLDKLKYDKSGIAHLGKVFSYYAKKNGHFVRIKSRNDH